MRDAIISVFFGITGGIFAQVVKICIIDPSIRYSKLKVDILINIQYFCDAINTEMLNEYMKQKGRDRREKFLKLSAELYSTHETFVWAFNWAPKFIFQPVKKIMFGKDDIFKAVKALRGLSNTNDYSQAYSYTTRICIALNIDKDALEG